MTRLTTEFWVRAYLARLRAAAIPAYITASGDPDSGAVIVKVATLDGRCKAFQRSFDLALDRRIWVELGDGPEPRIDDVLRRQSERDRDLWVVEIEDRSGRHLLDQDGLDS